MRIVNLPPLVNIIHLIGKNLETVSDNEETPYDYFLKYYPDIIEVIHLGIEEYLGENMVNFYDPYFTLNMQHPVKLHLFELYRDVPMVVEVLEAIDLGSIIGHEITTYFLCNHIPRRSHNGSVVVRKLSADEMVRMEKQIAYLENVEQPEQRTDAWYDFRWNLLTASSISKALGSQAAQNQLILSKCLPIDKDKYSRINMDSPFEWGKKYEPISTMLYERKYDTVIGEFGCIKDLDNDFIGASPDGINVKKENERYGRMLEIKNPISREITGVPKSEYWVQMQIQMMCCRLRECDFYETKFVEYLTRDDFINDVVSTTDIFKSKERDENGDFKTKGVIKVFSDGETIDIRVFSLRS